MLKRFIKVNRDISTSFIRKYPNFSHGRRSAFSDFEALIKDVLEKRGSGPFTILEIGGIDRPSLKKDTRYTYIGLDVEINNHCYQLYDEFYLQSVEEPIPVKADVIISKTVLEHVPDVTASFQRMHDCLNEGGEMIHLVPSGYHPYSLATKFVGNKWQRKLIPLLISKDASKRLGYKAYYNMCSYRQMKRLLGSLSPVRTNITPYWDAVGYFKFFFPLFLTIVTFNRISEVFRLSQLASYIIVYFEK